MNWLLLSAHVHEDLKLLTLATTALLLGAAALAYSGSSVAGRADYGKRSHGGPLLERGEEEHQIVAMLDEPGSSKPSESNSDS